MSNTTNDRSLVDAAAEKPPFYRDAVVVKWIAQVLTLALVLFALLFLANQAGDSLEAKGINTGFDFLNIDPGISLNGTIADDPDTGGRALWAGMTNTLRLAAGGIFFATLLGILVGVARLSNNWMISKLASAFIEYMRNIPLLVHIILFFAVIGALDAFGREREPVFENGVALLDEDGEQVTEAIQGPFNGLLHISNKGVSVPRLHFDDGFYQWMVFILVGAVIGHFVRKTRQAQQDRTGATTYPISSGLGVVAVFGVIGWFLHPIFGFLDGPLNAIGDAIGSIPQAAMQLILSVLALGGAGIWIKRFLDSRRTPAGLAKLTDDDWFRMIFAGVAALIALAFWWVIWPGGADWIINSTSDLFNQWGSAKFGEGRDDWRADPPLNIALPDIEQRGNFANAGPAGLNISAGFTAVFLAIVLFTAAFIAEIVRGGILAVPKGQTEAAQAIGLKRSTMLRRVILPQAFRVSLPPLGNQYLNLTKNTSLAIAVGATDLVQVGQTIFNQTGRSLEVFAIWMLFYLTCSLVISVVVNFFNVRLAIVER